MPLTQNILQAARTQMAVTLSAEKPLEKRIDRSGRTLARRQIPYAARRKKRHSRSRNQQKRQLPHFQPFLCNSPARIRLQHTHHTGTSRSQRCEHHHDLYPCSEPRGWRRGKSARQNLDFYKYPCKICANSQKMIYTKKISKNYKDFTPTFFAV